MIQFITACVLVASTSAHKQIISTQTLRITGLRQPTRIYECAPVRIDTSRPLRTFVPAAVPMAMVK